MSRIRVLSRSFNIPEGNRIVIGSDDGSNDVVHAVQGAINGSKWIRFVDDQLEVCDAFIPPEEPDPMIPPKRYHAKGNFIRFDIDEDRFQASKDGHHFPSFFLTGVGAGAKDLDEARGQVQCAGFEYMRSRRGEDNKFWEVWYLPGLYQADNKFKEALDEVPQSAKLETAITWIINNLRFGSLEVTVQRAALCCDD